MLIKTYRFSHSSKELFLLCSKRWQFKYVDKWSSPKIGSALFFGNALDAGFSRILLEKKKVLTPEETALLSKTAEEVFYENMLTFRHNRKIVDLPKNVNCDYYTSDFDPFLIYDKNLELLRAYAPDIENFTEFHIDCKAIFKAKQKISTDDRILYNYMSWLCLVEKGKLMLEAYQKEVMPQIEEVFDLQKKIIITNDVGDSITGSIDVTLSFLDEPGVKYITDNKSSSKPYKEDSVLESAQLATYCEAEGTNKAAYIVIEKKVYRRLPFVHTQVIRNIIPEETFVKTFDNFEKMVYSVQSEKFEKNEDSCFAFGKRCEYWDLCKKGSIRGLVKVLDET